MTKEFGIEAMARNAKNVFEKKKAFSAWKEITKIVIKERDLNYKNICRSNEKRNLM